MVEIVVAEEDRFGRGALAAADDAVVRQLVEEDGIPRAHDVRDHRDVGEVAAHERHDLLDADEIGQGLFQDMVGRALAADEAGSQRADADRVDRLARRRLHRGMVGEAEIIVVGEADETRPPRTGLAPGRVDGHEEGVVLVEIGLAREAEAFGGVIRQALRFLHGRHSGSGWEHGLIRKRGRAVAGRPRAEGGDVRRDGFRRHGRCRGAITPRNCTAKHRMSGATRGRPKNPEKRPIISTEQKLSGSVNSHYKA